MFEIHHDGSEFGGMPDGKPLSVLLSGAKGRFLRIQLPGNECLHLDEVEVFDTGYHRNHALGKPANQSSTSPWSTGSLVAALREPSKITPGPVGSWPLDFSSLVQPVLEKYCVRCHQTDTEGAKTDLTAAKAYETLVGYGERNLRAHVWTRHRQGFSTPGACGAKSSSLMKLLKKGHYQVKLSRADMDRLITWMDTYAQRTGSFSPDQQRRLRDLRMRMARLLAPSN